MTWTTRSDDASCCGDIPGRVEDHELVGRYLHSGNAEPIEKAFKRDDLTRPKKGHDDTCGLADGCSIDRVSALSDEEIRVRAHARAGAKNNSLGMAVAEVAAIRSLTHDGDPLNRAVYIYDDPMVDNLNHAVMRVSEHLPRADFDKLRVKLIAIFSGRRGE